MGSSSGRPAAWRIFLAGSSWAEGITKDYWELITLKKPSNVEINFGIVRSFLKIVKLYEMCICKYREREKKYEIQETSGNLYLALKIYGF